MFLLRKNENIFKINLKKLEKMNNFLIIKEMALALDRNKSDKYTDFLHKQKTTTLGDFHRMILKASVKNDQEAMSRLGYKEGQEAAYRKLKQRSKIN